MALRDWLEPPENPTTVTTVTTDKPSKGGSVVTVVSVVALDCHWRWLFHYQDGEAVEYRILPETTEQELRALYPQVVRFEPLPDTLQ
jgi:hypothetical protein